MVVDDASTDRTVDLVRSFQDARIRVVVNRRNLGLVANRNYCVKLSKGSLVKFLFQDDLLYPECVEKMTRIFKDHENVGMVFAPRDVLLENPRNQTAIAWKKRHGILHTRFTNLRHVNHGIILFNEWLASGFRENWVGEPSSVMLRRSCLEWVGLFNTRIRMCSDYEMWIRIMYFCDVGFIDESLSALRFHSVSATSAGLHQNRYWLDMMWLLEGLLGHDEISQSHPQIRRLRYIEAARVMMQQVTRVLRRDPMPALYLLRSLRDYLSYRLRSLRHDAPPLHETLR